jgi:hypothetical protein
LPSATRTCPQGAARARGGSVVRVRRSHSRGVSSPRVIGWGPFG